MHNSKLIFFFLNQNINYVVGTQKNFKIAMMSLDFRQGNITITFLFSHDGSFLQSIGFLSFPGVGMGYMR